MKDPFQKEVSQLLKPPKMYHILLEL